jgi:hypothetical protein
VGKNKQKNQRRKRKKAKMREEKKDELNNVLIAKNYDTDKDLRYTDYLIPEGENKLDNLIIKAKDDIKKRGLNFVKTETLKVPAQTTKGKEAKSIFIIDLKTAEWVEVIRFWYK